MNDLYKGKQYPSAIGFSEADTEFKEAENKNKCPYRCNWGDSFACARWGSATPLRHFKRECTFEDLQTCPLKDYSNEARALWFAWLEQQGIYTEDKSLIKEIFEADGKYECLITYTDGSMHAVISENGAVIC
jgi:hypothetical protein